MTIRAMDEWEGCAKEELLIAEFRQLEQYVLIPCMEEAKKGDTSLVVTASARCISRTHWRVKRFAAQAISRYPNKDKNQR